MMDTLRSGMLLAALLSVLPACGEEECDPDAAEICNNRDDNCNGEIDEGLEQRTFYADGDDDGFGTPLSSVSACERPEGYATNDSDCDDQDAAVSPDAAEVCDDADNDCDGLADDADGSLTDGITGYIDGDGDGFGGAPGFDFCVVPSGFITEGGDCDDFDSAITLGRPWYVDSDDDGYGDPDSLFESCADPGAGYTEDATDCDDTEAGTNPGAEEICDDGVDNNCDETAGSCAPIGGEVSVTEASATITGASTYQGRWLSAADFDGDGRNEVVTSDLSGFSGQGGVYVFSDITDGDSLSTDDASGALYGSSNTAAGLFASVTPDLTDDGTHDLVTQMTDGSILVFAGPVEGQRSIYNAVAFLDGLYTSSYSADAATLAADDFSGDGVADLLIGDPLYTEDYTYEGRAFLLAGPISGDIDLSRSALLIYGDASTQAYLGWQTMSAGDTNGDGSNEVLIAARRSSYDVLYGGAVYLIEGDALEGSVSVPDTDTVLYGSSPSGYFGHDIGAGGDVNGDGYGDVVVGAYNAGTGGEAYVFHGPFGEVREDTRADAIISAEESGVYLGWRVAVVGDVNDDGVDDVAFSALLLSHEDADGNTVSSGGAVGVAYGPVASSLSFDEADGILYPDSTVYFGHDIAGVGDISGDGIDDLAVSGYNSATTWLFFGGSGL